MKETAESVWELTVTEPEIDPLEAVLNMFEDERTRLEEACIRVLKAINEAKQINRNIGETIH